MSTDDKNKPSGDEPKKPAQAATPAAKESAQAATPSPAAQAATGPRVAAEVVKVPEEGYLKVGQVRAYRGATVYLTAEQRAGLDKFFPGHVRVTGV